MASVKKFLDAANQAGRLMWQHFTAFHLTADRLAAKGLGATWVPVG